MLVFGLSVPAYAYTHNVYDNGSISSTYLTYFRDILSGISLNDNYIAFRDGQYSYIMVVGDLDCNGDVITLNGTGKSYVFKTDNTQYNSQYKYYVSNINSFNVKTDNFIVYSDVGDYPQLIERGAKYEILTTIIVVIVCISIVISRIFRKR